MYIRNEITIIFHGNQNLGFWKGNMILLGKRQVIKWQFVGAVAVVITK